MACAAEIAKGDAFGLAQADERERLTAKDGNGVGELRRQAEVGAAGIEGAKRPRDGGFRRSRQRDMSISRRLQKAHLMMLRTMKGCSTPNPDAGS